MNNVQKFEELKGRFDKAKTDFTRVETLLTEKRKEYKKVEQELRALGVEPDDLDKVFAKLSADIMDGFGQMKSLLEQAEVGLQKVGK